MGQARGQEGTHKRQSSNRSHLSPSLLRGQPLTNDTPSSSVRTRTSTARTEHKLESRAMRLSRATPPSMIVRPSTEPGRTTSTTTATTAGLVVNPETRTSTSSARPSLSSAHLPADQPHPSLAPSSGAFPARVLRLACPSGSSSGLLVIDWHPPQATSSTTVISRPAHPAAWPRTSSPTHRKPNSSQDPQRVGG